MTVRSTVLSVWLFLIQSTRRKWLAEAGYLCRLTEVLGVELDDEVGALNRLLISLEESNINVDYLYLSFNRDSGKPVMVLHTDDVREVEHLPDIEGI